MPQLNRFLKVLRKIPDRISAVLTAGLLDFLSLETGHDFFFKILRD
jgi:hypothetical protein